MQKPKLVEDHAFLAQQRRVGEEVIRGVEEQIDRAHELSAWKRLREVSFFAILYLSGAALVAIQPGILAIAIAGVILMGTALNSLGILIHEGLHGLLAKNGRLNHLASFLCGLPILISASAYQATHCDHHFELGRKLDYGTYMQHLENKRLVWVAYLAQLFLGSIIYVIFIPVLALESASARARLMIGTEYLVIFSGVAALFYSVPLDMILLYWIYPLIVLMMLSNIRGLASHALGDYEDIYLSSRTVKSSPIVSFLFLHENYHLEHHLFPQVPSYHLKETHALVWDRLPRALYSRSYLSFLAGFLSALVRRDFTPLGVVHPSRKTATVESVS